MNEMIKHTPTGNSLDAFGIPQRDPLFADKLELRTGRKTDAINIFLNLTEVKFVGFADFSVTKTE